MKQKVQTLDTVTRPKLRLMEIERIIKRRRLIVPPLSRRTLNNMCEQGVFETAGSRPHAHIGWLVYEDSFRQWIDQLEKEI
ncbi:MAG: hypothetical protein ABI878_06270 [Acidobacteriota bacterium]